MKPQIQNNNNINNNSNNNNINNNNNNNNNNGGIVELLIPTIFQKKLLMRGQKLFYVKNLWGGCSKLKD